jgi:tetratricopeptide (TPR) repeat protein
MPPPVSLCLIAKNEEAALPDCLRPVAGLFKEIIVADTGSTDRTPEIAAQFGARVIDFPWCDDFAAARNEALRHATGDWVFWLDADDRLDDANCDQLAGLFAGLRDENAAFVMTSRSPSGVPGEEATDVGHVRLFPNRPDNRWRYRVHEQILPALVHAHTALHWTDIVIEHTGYRDPALRRRKLERNLRLLHLDHADHPDEPYILFNLGWSYLDLGRPAEAVPFLHRSLEHCAPGVSIVRKLYALVAQAHRRLGQLPDALAACRAGLARCPGDGELLLFEGALLQQRGDFAGAEARWLRLLPAQPGGNGVGAGAPPGERPPRAPTCHPARQVGDLPHLAWPWLRRGAGSPRARRPQPLWQRGVKRRTALPPRRGQSCRCPGTSPAPAPASAASPPGTGWPCFTAPRDAPPTPRRSGGPPSPSGRSSPPPGPASASWPSTSSAGTTSTRPSPSCAATPPGPPPPPSSRPAATWPGGSSPRPRPCCARPGPATRRHCRPASSWPTPCSRRDATPPLPRAPCATCWRWPRPRPNRGATWRCCCGIRAGPARQPPPAAPGWSTAPATSACTCCTACCCTTWGDLTTAETCLVRALEALPAAAAGAARDQAVAARHHLAQIYQVQRRTAEAEMQWRAVLAERPDVVAAWLGLAELLLAQGRWPELEALASRLETLPDGPAGAAVVRARACLARREFEPARRLAEEAIEQAPSAVGPRLVLAEAQVQEGRDPAAAERALRAVLALDPANAPARHHLDLLLRQQGRPPGDG